MNQVEVRRFLERYFDAHQAKYVEKTPHYFSVELPIEVDKDLGNRPFYWTYVERLNLEPQPMYMNFIFHPEHVPQHFRGEKITFGSPRLQQFFVSARRRGQYIRLYEHHGKHGPFTRGNNPLIPWLGINIRVSMICDVKKDMLLSLGFNLVHGTIVDSFIQTIKEKDCKQVMPDYAYTIPPIFSLESAMGRIENYIHQLIQQQDQSWAEQARERLAREMSLVEHFYVENDDEQKRKEKEKRLEELRWQFEPRIEVDIINGGLFYLAPIH